MLIGDLTDRAEGVGQRWPLFLEEAARVGVRAVFAFPIRIGAIGLAAWTCSGVTRRPRRPSSAHAAPGRPLSDALLDLDTYQQRDGLLSPQMVVHQAAGIAMVQLGSSIEHAMLRLRSTAFAEEISINAVATDVVSGRRILARSSHEQ